jgi:hypothetical protein
MICRKGTETQRKPRILIGLEGAEEKLLDSEVEKVRTRVLYVGAGSCLRWGGNLE